MDITQAVGESLRISLGFSLIYLFGTIGFILAFIAFLKLLIWLLTKKVTCMYCTSDSDKTCQECGGCTLCCNCRKEKL